MVCSIAFVVSLPVFPILVVFPNYPSLIHKLSLPLGIALNNFASAIPSISFRMLLFWGSVLFGMICVKIAWRRLSWPSALLLSILANATMYCLVVDFSRVNNYPFSLGWSDVSRFYDASLFFARQLYGQQIPLPVLHPTWHLLLTVPYFFGSLPIWVHRLWQACLELVLTLATGVVFTRRLKIHRALSFWGIVLWAYLFLRQVQVVFSLLPAVIIILGWAEPRRFWRTTLMVLLASIWAGLSRLNWFPVPGMLAGALFLLEVPYQNSKSWLRYLWQPAIWLLGGTLLAFSVNSLYNVASGNAIRGAQFASSLTSDLLWYRLLPNTTLQWGILLTAFLASAPLILIIILVLRRHPQTLHPLQLAGIFLAMGVLLAGGLVVSIKVGGGSDLHNLDAYFVMLMLVGGYLYFYTFKPDISKHNLPTHNFALLILVIAVPVWFILRTGGTLFTWDHLKTDKTVEVIRAQAEQVAQAGGEVLFISQRQLLALKMVNVPLIPAYEQDYLMEMAMSHNRSYLDQFQNDLRQHRFAMIVVDPQVDHIYQRDRSFADENNLWVLAVSRPLLCYYKSLNLPGMIPDVALYVPGGQPCK